MEILADTSFLVYLLTTPSFTIDALEDELGSVELVVTRSVMRELKGLSRSKRIKVEALKLKRVLDYNGRADDDIVAAAVKEGLPVITMDMKLAKRVKEAGGRCYVLHQGRPVQL